MDEHYGAFVEEFGPAIKPELGYMCTSISCAMKSAAIMIGENMQDFIRYFKPVNPYPHLAVYDARTQGLTYVHFCRWRKSFAKKLQTVMPRQVIKTLYT